MSTRSKAESPIFDLSLLPPAQLQFLVVSDTHYLLPENAQAAEWASVSEFPARTERALRMAGALPVDFAVHLGDVSHEYPETGRAQAAREAALAQFRSFGLDFYQAAGNMDIGDKPDPTSPAEWVNETTLNEWHATFGPSWQSFDCGEIHGIVLNTQIMNGQLPEAAEQERWAEADLAVNAGRRLLLFLHMPIFFVDPDEQALGFYNSLDEPARGWLIGLIQRYGIDLVFAGHTHFVALNRLGASRMYVAPSTATSRAGLAEAYTVLAPDRGRSDVDKLGFYLVRLDAEGSSIHLIRSGRETPALDAEDPRKILVTRVPRELPHGRLGLFASHPLGHMTPGPVIWPSIVRQPVRDDWRPLAALELGAKVVRVPASDLTEPNERERLAVLRDEGIGIAAYWLWSDRLDLADEIVAHQNEIDDVEIVLPGETVPPIGLLDQIRRLQATDLPVTLSPALRGFQAPGQYHQRTRVGYVGGELLDLQSWLTEHKARIDRVACRLSPGESPWATIDTARSLIGGVIGTVDFYLDFSGEDDGTNASAAAEAIVAVATVPNARLVLGPLLDLDRSMDVTHGLLDRLSNPRPPFHVARSLNTLLFSAPEALDFVTIATYAAGRRVELRQGNHAFHLLLPNDPSAPGEMLPVVGELLRDTSGIIYDLRSGESAEVEGDEIIRSVLDTSRGPLLVTA